MTLSLFPFPIIPSFICWKIPNNFISFLIVWRFFQFLSRSLLFIPFTEDLNAFTECVHVFVWVVSISFSFLSFLRLYPLKYYDDSFLSVFYLPSSFLLRSVFLMISPWSSVWLDFGSDLGVGSSEVLQQKRLLHKKKGKKKFLFPILNFSCLLDRPREDVT